MSTIFGKDTTKLRFGNGKHGKPYLIGSELKFNISHSNAYVACAVGDGEMGIDVEKTSKAELPEIYNFFAPSEIEMINALPQDIQADMFYKIWTLKESYVKKSGDGLYCSFDSFSFDLTGDRICLNENEKTDCESAFISNKLYDNYWYSVCFSSDEELNDMFEYDIFSIIDSFG